jgi:hypothetical protein
VHVKVPTITDFWLALGVAIAVVEIAHLLCERAIELKRVDLKKNVARLAYVNTTPSLSAGLSAARATLFCRVAPLFALTGCFISFLSALSLTIFPKYCNPVDDADLYHALNAPFYVGLATAYLATFVMLAYYIAARSARVSASD